MPLKLAKEVSRLRALANDNSHEEYVLLPK